MSNATIRSAGMIIYYKKGNDIEYLLLHYPGGYWEFAKGKMESGETKQMTARREIKEETGLEPELQPGFQESIAYQFRDRYGNRTNKEVTFFIGYSTTQEVILSHEHQGFIWLPFEQALNKLTYQNCKDLIMHADHFIRENLLKESRSE